MARATKPARSGKAARPTKTSRVSRAYRVDDGARFRLKDHDAADSGGVDKADSDALLAHTLERLSELQGKLYAQHQWAFLAILQGIDASGKDSVIKYVMHGVNPLGCQAYAFKAPSSGERDHDYLWRHVAKLPERGNIGIFNRSYYEEVLIVRVHPEILEEERIPPKLLGDDVWTQRFKDIRAHERYLAHNGIVVRKFFLNISKGEQRKRFLERLDRPEKNWKFNPEDLGERAHWDKYMSVYEDMIRNTSTPEAPWFVVPADKKWFTRLVVADAIVEALEGMGVDYPKLDDEKRREIDEARKIVAAEKE